MRRCPLAFAALLVAFALCGATRVYGQTPPNDEARLAQADSLERLVLGWYDARRFAEALPLAREVLRLRTDVLGTTHPAVGTALINLGGLSQQTGSYAEARRFFERARALYEKAFPPDHPIVSIALDKLAGLAEMQGDYAEAERLYAHSLRLLELGLPPHSPEIADGLNSLAMVRYTTGRFAEAIPLHERALAIRTDFYGPSHPDVATSLNNLGLAHYALGAHAEAADLYQRALAIRRKAFGPTHPSVATGLNNLGMVRFESGDYEAARAHFEEALAIDRADGARSALSRATTLNNLGLVYRMLEDFGTAQALWEEALDVREALSGPEHPGLVVTLINLGQLYFLRGEYAPSRAFLERALAIQEAASGPGHPTVAAILNNLAEVFFLSGDYAQARPLHERALAIRQAALGPEHALIGESLNNLARLYFVRGDYAAARQGFERAWAMLEATAGPTHPLSATALHNLAEAALADGDVGEARTLHERVLALREALFGSTHTEVAMSLNNLAVLDYKAADYPAAQARWERACDLLEVLLSPDHPWTTLCTLNLGGATVALGDSSQARALFVQAAHGFDRQAALLLPTLSFAEQAAFLRGDLTLVNDYLLSTHWTPDQLRASYPLLARWKGLLLHSLRSQTAIRALADDPAHAATVAALETARSEIAAWVVRPATPSEGSAADHRARLATLTTEKERLERRLAAVLPEGTLDDPLRAPGFPGLAAYLAPHEAFVDVFRYKHTDGGVFVEDRYAAIVTAPAIQPSPWRLDLGVAETLDAALATWRRAVAQGGGAALQRIAQDRLDRRLRAAFAEALPPTITRVWFSPDGALARLPASLLAEALAGPDERLLSYVPSARALVRLRTSTRVEADGLLVAGGLDFGADSTGAARPYALLPGTVEEVEALAAFAAETGRRASVLTGATAVPDTVIAAMRGARVIHLATHGFFAAEATSSTGRGPAVASWPPEWSGPAQRVRASGGLSGSLAGAAPHALARNPLAESGLALAGANAGPTGVVTAETLVGLDLSGAELVVLSACETGLGREAVGQGVLGLQASLLAAGARGLLMSLWNVPDASTAHLMVAFYRGLWREGMAPAQALRHAQEEVRAAGYTNPIHWAGWVLVGEAW